MTQNYQIPLKYSQNFIKSSELVRKLIDLSAIDKEDTVLEIGSGNGIITAELAKKAKKVIAIEKDKNLYLELVNKFKGINNIEIIHADFLEYKIPFDLRYKVFSNIPFSITSEITKKLFSSANPPTRSYLFMQKEVGQKFLGSPVETLSSLITKPFFDVAIIHHFHRSDFFPEPSVDVALVEFKKKKISFVDNKTQKLYREFITYALSQWKDDIRKSLRKIFSNLQIKILAENLGFGMDSKPTDLNFDQWMGLFYFFLDHVPYHKQKLIKGSEDKLSGNQLKMRKENLGIFRKR